MKVSGVHILYLCVGCIIGWGAFVLPGELFLPKMGLLNSILGLVLGAVIVGLIAYNYTFLLSSFPRVGGEFLFTLKVLGRMHGFVCGWFLSLAYLCIIPLNATALGLLMDSFGIDFGLKIIIYHIGDSPIFLRDVLVGCLSIWFVALINIRGIYFAFAFQKVLMLVLCGSILLFFVLMIFNFPLWNNLNTYFENQDFDWHSVLKVLAIAPWLYVGFDCAVQVIGEVSCNIKAFRIWTYLSIIIGCVLYILVILITALGVSLNEIESFIWASGESIHRVFGNIGSMILGVGIFGAIMSGINGFFITTSKVLLAMSEHKIVPFALGNFNVWGIPYRIMIFIAIVSCVMPFFGRKALLYVVDMSCLGVVIAFLYVGVVSLLIKKKTLGRIAPMSIIGILLGLFFLALLFAPYSPAVLQIPSLVALAVWVCLGIGFYVLRFLRK